jgi:type I restriction enzyme S subunit
MNEKKGIFEEWKKTNIRELLSDSFAGGTPNRSRDDYFGGSIPWISSGEINSRVIYDTKEKITQLGLENSSAKWIPTNAVLIAMYGATAGQVAKLKINATSNQAVLALISSEKIMDRDFLYHSLRFNKEKILYLAQGSGQPNLSKDLVERFELSYPKNVSIQKYIANILDICDKVIEQTEAVIAKYKAIKQGMLHDLFTRGLDKNGKLRPTQTEAPELYKESELGLIPKDWDVKHLNEVVDIRVSNIDKKSYENEQSIRLCNYMDVYSNEYITSLLDFMNATANQNQINRFSIEKGDVIITKDSESPDDIGVPSVVQENLSNVVCGYHLALLKPRKIFGFFLAKQLSMFDINRYLANRANGSTRFGLTLHVIESMPILYPLSKLEQKLIFSRLQSIDVKIQAEEKILKKYIDVKTGLMNRLLNNF